MRTTRETISLIGMFCVILFPVLAEDIPIEQLLNPAEFEQFRISPDGSKLSALAKWNGSMNIFIIDNNDRVPLRISSIKKHSVVWHSWVNESRLIFRLRSQGHDVNGLFAIDCDGSNFTVLKNSGLSVDGITYRYSLPFERFASSDKEILIAAHRQESPHIDLLRLDIHTGQASLHAAFPEPIKKWYIDWDGNALLAETQGLDQTTEFHYRPSVNSPWQSIGRFGFGEPSWKPAIANGKNSPFSRDGSILYVSSNIGRITAAIHPYQLAKRELGSAIYAHDTYDVTSIIQSRKKGRIVGVGYQGKRPVSVWLNRDKQVLQSFLNYNFPGMATSVVDQSDDESKMVIVSFSDRIRSIYSVLSIEDGKPKLEVVAARQAVEPSRLSKVMPIEFETHDGLILHGYLTLPSGLSKKPHPMIVHPHGGPWHRDVWQYNPDVQYMANRGFAVLQIDFRSSIGYGRAFLHAGNKKWGTAMQEDIVYGVRWAIRQGYADPKRIGIYGSSYGGYTAMAQLVFHPELYQFGICSVGPVDLSALIDWRKRLAHDITYDYYRRTIGDPATEREMLDAQSPINFIDRLKAPLMIIHGQQDMRVPISQAQQLKNELTRLGKEFVWLVDANEGHGFRDIVSRIDQYKQMDAFLKPFRDL